MENGRIIFVDPVELDGAVHGDGISSVVLTAIKSIRRPIGLVGCSARHQGIRGFEKIPVLGRNLEFASLGSRDKVRSTRLKSASLKFSLLFLYWLAFKDGSEDGDLFVTHTWTVYWVLCLLGQARRAVFIFPGFANPVEIGRQGRFLRSLAFIYDWFHYGFLTLGRNLFAAASRESVARANRRYFPGFPERITQLPTCIDPSIHFPMDRREARGRLGLDLDGPIFTYIGRLAEVKGIDLILAAAVEFIGMQPGATWLLVGDGEARAKLEEFVREHGLEGRIKFLGRRSQSDASLCIAGSDCCLMASYSEGFSSSMLEYAACGVPIVSTAVSGAEEIIQDGISGLIVRERSPKRYAEAMATALGYGQGARERSVQIRARFAMDQVWASFVERLESS